MMFRRLVVQKFRGSEVTLRWRLGLATKVAFSQNFTAVQDDERTDVVQTNASVTSR